MRLCLHKYVYVCLCVGAFRAQLWQYILVTDAYTISDLNGSTQEKGTVTWMRRGQTISQTARDTMTLFTLIIALMQ